ncbi:60S ribosomal protein L7/L12 [Flammula alnicola]|nr:60S ribosomal protein L7/L12 [Flammula alnicola]
MASRCPSALRALPRTTFSVRCSRTAISARWLATAAEATKSTPPPPPPAAKTSSDPTVTRIVDDISGLTLLQAADLVTLLKTRLNIQEVAMPAAAPAPAAGQAAAPASDEPAAEKPKEKTVFNVKLESFDAGSKPKVIREVKALVPNLTLMDAKKFVESVPKILKENLSKEDAEKLQKVFEGIGAVVKLE